MKKLLALTVVLALAMSCTACTCIPVELLKPRQPQASEPQNVQPLETLPEEEAPTQAPTEPATEPPTEPVPTEPVPTEPAPTEPASKVPYTMQFPASYDIFNMPGYHFRYVRDIGLTGVYTIVEEQYDEFGNLWGKLKSGIGWVQLSGDIPSSNYTRTCPDCGLTEPDVFFDKEYESEYCDNCSYGKGNGGSVLFCWQCGADCTYRGVEEDGRCEDCYYGN